MLQRVFVVLIEIEPRKERELFLFHATAVRSKTGASLVNRLDRHRRISQKLTKILIDKQFIILKLISYSVIQTLSDDFIFYYQVVFSFI